ncbi:MAG: cytochrome C [Aliarcobacter sp.]|nr:cytochrome C [Aliarcobacter sp.]
MKLLNIIMAGALALGIASSSLSADAVKGQKLYTKLLKDPCGITGAKFAAKHSQEEWKQLKESGAFEAEMIKICPNLKAGDIKESLHEHIVDFAIEFASDSGNVPSC